MLLAVKSGKEFGWGEEINLWQRASLLPSLLM